MNKKILLIPLLGIIIILIIIGSGSYKQKNSNTIEYQLNGKTYRLLIADDEMERNQGLMSVRKKEGFDGMIFLYPDKQMRTFWNQNTFVELDVYWLDDDKVVGKSFLPSIEKSKTPVTVSSEREVNKVVEIIRN